MEDRLKITAAHTLQSYSISQQGYCQVFLGIFLWMTGIFIRRSRNAYDFLLSEIPTALEKLRLKSLEVTIPPLQPAFPFTITFFPWTLGEGTRFQALPLISPWSRPAALGASGHCGRFGAHRQRGRSADECVCLMQVYKSPVLPRGLAWLV